MGNKWAKWTVQDLQFLQDNCNEMTSLELAERLGVNVNRVQSKLWAMGLKAKRTKPVHTPRPAQKKVIDEAVNIKNATEEMHKAMGALDNRATILGAQAELLQTMQALTAGKISPKQAMAALEIGAYLIESAGDHLEAPSAVIVPMVSSTLTAKSQQHKPRKVHPWRELDKSNENAEEKPTSIIAATLMPKCDYVPPAIGRVTKVVDGVRK